MNYTKLITEYLARIEESSGKENEEHKRQLHNSKEKILAIVELLHRQLDELRSEIVVMDAIKREGN